MLSGVTVQLSIRSTPPSEESNFSSCCKFFRMDRLPTDSVIVVLWEPTVPSRGCISLTTSGWPSSVTLTA